MFTGIQRGGGVSVCSGLAQQTDEGGEAREREDHSLFSQCGQRRDPLTVWGWRAGAGMKGCGDGGPAAEGDL